MCFLEILDKRHQSKFTSFAHINETETSEAQINERRNLNRENQNDTGGLKNKMGISLNQKGNKNAKIVREES